MDEPVMTAQQLEARTTPDPASVAAIVARAMRVRSRSKPKHLHVIPIHGGVTSDRPVDGSPSRISP